MNVILEGIKGAFKLIFSFDKGTYDIIFLSLFVSITASIIGSFIGILFGFILGLKDFFLKKFFVKVVYTFMSIPPVVVGLFVFLLFSRKSIFGFLKIIYTPKAMIIAQVLLVLPIVTGFVYNVVKQKGHTIMALGKTLGASKSQQLLLLLKELKTDLLVGVVTAYGRAISEVGAVMLVGGNIAGNTRVMTTTIATQLSMGKYDGAIALGLVLLLISFIVQSILFKFQEH